MSELSCVRSRTRKRISENGDEFVLRNLGPMLESSLMHLLKTVEKFTIGCFPKSP